MNRLLAYFFAPASAMHFLMWLVLAAPAAANPACEKSAADKKLAGAAKTSHIKKCMADAGAKK